MRLGGFVVNRFLARVAFGVGIALSAAFFLAAPHATARPYGAAPCDLTSDPYSDYQACLSTAQGQDSQDVTAAEADRASRRSSCEDNYNEYQDTDLYRDCVAHAESDYLGDIATAKNDLESHRQYCESMYDEALKRKPHSNQSPASCCRANYPTRTRIGLLPSRQPWAPRRLAAPARWDLYAVAGFAAAPAERVGADFDSRVAALECATAGTG